MTEFTHVEGQEVWVHSRRVGFITEHWFYPVPGAQLSSIDLEEIVKEMQEPSTPSFDVIEWYELPDGRRKATVKIQAYTVEPATGITVFLDGVLYTIENVTRIHDRHRILEIIVTAVPATLPADIRQTQDQWTEQYEKQAKGLLPVPMPGIHGPLHPRVENDQSDDVSRSMKPSGDL